MLQNLKVDIIYHLTNSDFEMEFNLCGCCRMRLLTDKTNDRKGFINALSRAVSRSRIIMVCGPLFSAEGLISTVATAIGRKVTPVDNAAYGINGEDIINIISGSTPLVTPDGYFGGCIIESGPQTIVLLTENKTLRKAIMQNLIHPYVEEISMLPVREKAPATPAAEPEQPPAKEVTEQIAEEAVEETPAQAPVFEPPLMDIITQTPDTDALTEEIQETEAEVLETEDEAAETAEEPVEETAENTAEAEMSHTADDTADTVAETENEDTGENTIPFVFDNEPAAEDMEAIGARMEQQYDDMYIKPERVKHSHTDKYAASYTPTEENDSFLSDDEDAAEYLKRGRRARALNIPIIILAVILLAVIGVICYFMLIKPQMQGISTTEYLREIFGTASNTVYI